VNRVFVFFILMLTGMAVEAEAASSCSVPFIRTLNNQTVDGTMTMKAGKRCSITLARSSGPTFNVRIVAQPSHGSVRIQAPHYIFYQPRKGFVGSDSFTYARRGLDTRNNPITRTVRIAVTVTP
jgi:hypothetical protein